jgi:hypothetical protein
MEEYDLSFGEVNYVIERLKMKGKKVYDWKLIIWTSVCYANNCCPASTRGFGEFSCCGRKINVFLNTEMFKYLTGTIERMAKDECKGRGHKYNHDFKMAAAMTLRDRIDEYGERVSWAVDREQEIKNEREYRKLKRSKKEPGENFSFGESEALNAGIEAGKNISLHKQTGIEETKLIGA